MPKKMVENVLKEFSESVKLCSYSRTILLHLTRVNSHENI